MWLKIRMYLLMVIMFAILYGVIAGIGTWIGAGSALFYLVAAFIVTGLQYLISPSVVGLTMGIRWVTAEEAPRLHAIIGDLANKAGLPMPKVGVSEMSMPNAFAFGRSQHDGRVCVTRGILNLLNEQELKAVLGHEMSHIKHRDMAIMTLLSVVPMILYWVAWTIMWSGTSAGNGRDNKNAAGSYAVILGVIAYVLYYFSNLLVLYGSRIREYYADKGSVELGIQPHQLASALYKLAAGDARYKNQPEMKRTEGIKAFFVNDPSKAWNEVREVYQIDENRDGKISQDELMLLLQKHVTVGFGNVLMELFSTHPGMLKRISILATYYAS
jgi:heat shock protein HtpX